MRDDKDAALGLIRSISSVSRRSDIMPSFLLPVADAIGATAGAYFQLSSDDNQNSVELGDLKGPFSSAVEPYRLALFEHDPLYSCPAASPIAISRLFDRTNGHAARSYSKDFLIPHGVGDIIGLHFSYESLSFKKVISVSFPRTVGMPSYALREERLLAHLAPVMNIVLSNILLSENLTNIQDSMRVSTLAEAKRNRAMELNRALPARLATAYYQDMTAELLDKLTDRELQVVQCLRQGHSNTSLANTLSISVRTAENHLRSIYAKIGVSSRTQLLFKIFH